MAGESISQVSRLNTDRMLDKQRTLEATQEAMNLINANIEATQEDALGSLQDECEAMASKAAKTNKRLERSPTAAKTEKAKRAQESVLVRKEDADSLAGEFSQRQGNREYRLKPATLSQLIYEELGVGIHEDSHPDQIIAIVRKRLFDSGEAPDVAIVDKAMEFLLEAVQSQMKYSVGDDKTRLEKIHKKIETAKNKHFESHAVEIQVAQKIIGAVDAVVETTGQTVKEALDHYRDVVHNPPDIQTLRKFYEGKGYKAMVLELKGLSTYLGGNFKRTNLDNPELAQLAAAARKMQALLGVFRHSKTLRGTTMMTYLKSKGQLAA